MCIAYIHFDPHHRWPLVIAANRDEFHQRPTAIAHYWPTVPGLLAGQDLRSAGTWLGLNLATQRFALLTNFRRLPETVPDQPISRGLLVREFLQSTESAAHYLQGIEAHRDRYAGFNLLLGEHMSTPNATLWYYSNKSQQPPTPLPPGRYVLSNHLLDTPWPKALRLKAQMNALIEEQSGLFPEPFFDILNDRQTAPAEQLPDTGLEQEREKLLSSIFICSPDYGTRSSTVILLNAQGQGIFSEQSYDPTGQWTDRIDWPLC